MRKWNDYLKFAGLTDITNDSLCKTVQSQLGSINSSLSLATITQIFAECDQKKKKTDDPLSDKDRVFLHLLVYPEDLGWQ
jgi:hypothetical protein